MPMMGRIGAEPSFFFPKSWRATEAKRRQTTMRWVALRRGWQGKVLASTRRLLANSENRIPARSHESQNWVALGLWHKKV